MKVNTTKTAALALAGLTTYAMLVTAAFAAPPKTKKKPAKKSPTGKTTVIKGSDMTKTIALGKKVYAANGCANCHAIAGQGGKSGPELTKVGADTNHSVTWLTQHIESPTSHTPGSGMPAYKGKIKAPELLALATYLGSLKK